MGRVYRGRQLSLDRPVAVKVLHPALAADQEFIARFFNEAHAAARVSHPNFVNVHDFGQANGLFYYVMELINGQSLGDYLNRGERFSERECIEVGRETMLALQAAHAEGIVHRDVKPDNLMLTAEGVVKVADLGLAQTRAPWSVSTRDVNMSAGTPCYRSPEQAYGATNIDCRSDFYSLGATLFHLVTGRLPFLDHTAEAIFRRQTTHAPPDPRAVVPSISEMFGALIQRLMAPDPAQRPQSHAEIFEALQACDDQICRKTHHTSRITTSGASPLVVRSWLEKGTPWLVGAGALVTVGLVALAIRHRPAEPDAQALLGITPVAEAAPSGAARPAAVAPPASPAVAQAPARGVTGADPPRGPEKAAEVGYAGPPIHLGSPRIPGRLVVWPIFKNVSRHDGVGTLPDALKDATDIVAIAAYWLKDSSRLDGPSGSAIALRADGTVSAWGAKPERYGDPDWTQPPADLSGVTAVSIANYAVALRDNGDVVAWGHPALSRPRVFGGFLRVAAGNSGWIGIRPDGQLMRSHAGRGFDIERVDDAGRFIDVVAGENIFLALREDGTVKGLPTATSDTSIRLAQIPDDLRDVSALGATYGAAFALTGDGHIRVWGPGVPHKAEEFLGIVRLRVGKCHGMTDTVAMLDGSGHWFFMGSSEHLDVPACERMSEGCIDIAFAGDHAIGLKVDDVDAAIREERESERRRRSLFAFTPSAPLPPEPSQPKPAAAPAVAGPALQLERPCIAGRVVVWPLYSNAKHRDGLGTLPPELSGAYDICAISARSSNENDVGRPQGIGMALRTNGTVIVWGELDGGKSPQPPPEIADAVAVDVSGADCFALRADGTAFRWDSPNGVAEQLCDTISLQAASDYPAGFAYLRSGKTAFLGKDGYRVMLPQDFFESPTRWIQAAMTIPQHGMVALRAEGTIVYWGDGKGSPPHDLAGVRSIIAGHSHVFAIRHDGSLFRWGRDDPGGVVKNHPSVRRIRARLCPAYYRTSNQRNSVTAFQNREGKWSFEGADDFDAALAQRMSEHCIDLGFGAEYAIGLKVEDLAAALAAEDAHERRLLAMMGITIPAPALVVAPAPAEVSAATGAAAVAAITPDVFTEEEATELRRSLAPLRDALEAHATSDVARVGQYVKELDALEARFAARGDLDATVAVRAEREAWQGGHHPSGPAPGTKAPADLARLRYAIDRDLKDGDSRLDYRIKTLIPRAVQSLKSFEAKLTRATHLAAALAVREITDRVQKGDIPAAPTGPSGAMSDGNAEAASPSVALAGAPNEPRADPPAAAKTAPALGAPASENASGPILDVPARPARMGRVVVWPLYKDVKNHEGLGTIPPEVATASNVVAIAASPGNDTVLGGPQGVGMALLADGKVIAWGTLHELGSPKPPDDLADVVAIECAKRYCYAITAAGELVSWGKDDRRLQGIARICPSEIGDVAFVIDRHGKIALGTSQALQAAPKELPPVMDIRYSTGSHGCVLLTRDGIPICCGDVRGTPPKDIDPLVAIRTAHRATLGLTSKGKCVAWGTGLSEIPEVEEISKVRSAQRVCGRFVPAHYSTAKPRSTIVAIQEQSGRWRWFAKEADFDEKTCEKMSKDCIDIAFGAEHAIGLRVEE